MTKYLKNGIYDDTLLTHSLNTLDRLDYITEKIQNYGYNGNRIIILHSVRI